MLGSPCFCFKDIYSLLKNKKIKNTFETIGLLQIEIARTPYEG